MSCEDGKTREGDETKTEVDVHRAFRELQRWLHIDDQMRFLGGDGIPSNWKDHAKLIWKIVYNPKDRTVKYLRPDGQEFPLETTPESEK